MKRVVNQKSRRGVCNFPNYTIDINGQVYGTRGKRLQYITRGYAYIHLWKNNKQYNFRINRLVAIAFVPNPRKLKEVNHKDGNKLNNNADNLEWCTRSYNVQHSFSTGLRKSPVGNPKITKEIADKIRLEKGKATYEKIADKYGVKYSTVAHIMRGSRWNKKTDSVQ